MINNIISSLLASAPPACLFRVFHLPPPGTLGTLLLDCLRGLRGYDAKILVEPAPLAAPRFLLLRHTVSPGLFFWRLAPHRPNAVWQLGKKAAAAILLIWPRVALLFGRKYGRSSGATHGSPTPPQGYPPMTPRAARRPMGR